MLPHPFHMTRRCCCGCSGSEADTSSPCHAGWWTCLYLCLHLRGLRADARDGRHRRLLCVFDHGAPSATANLGDLATISQLTESLIDPWAAHPGSIHQVWHRDALIRGEAQHSPQDCTAEMSSAQVTQHADTRGGCRRGDRVFVGRGGPACPDRRLARATGIRGVRSRGPGVAVDRCSAERTSRAW